MNSLWQVARTYLWRPRFWVLGVAYAGTMGPVFFAEGTTARAQMTVSVATASLIVCFLALHVRRQFGSEVAQVTPSYAAPHLAVGAFVVGLFWAIIPGILTLWGKWPPGAVAAHAVVGMLAGVVAFWPRALILLVGLPFLLSWANSFDHRQRIYSDRLLDGQYSEAASLLVLGAVAAQVAAAILLVRLPRRGISTSDELALDAPPPAESNRLAGWMLASRDAAARRLAAASLLAAIKRWRIPVAISAFQLAMPLVAILAMCAIGWCFGAVAEWAMVGTLIVSALLLVAPYTPWHLRRRSLSVEFLRPVTRAAFFRQIVLAMAWDVLMWVGVASAISLVMFLTVARFNGEEPSLSGRFFFGYYAILWSMAVFLFGLALATMRWRMWLLLIAIGGMVWLMGIWWVGITVALRFGWVVPSPSVPIIWFALFSAATGLGLAWWTYRRWLEIDVA